MLSKYFIRSGGIVVKKWWHKLLFGLIVGPAIIYTLIVLGEVIITQRFFNRLHELPAAEGQTIVLFNPNDAIWEGGAEYLTKHLDKIINIAKDKHLLPRNVLPIRLGIKNLWLITGRAQYPSYIIISTRALHYGEDELNNLLVHEFTHLLVTTGHLDFGVWERVCASLLSALKHSEAECGG